MRLHTNFRDYYDTAIGFGIDEKVHYNRASKNVHIQIKSRSNLPTFGKCGLLGFCGQIYPFVELNRHEWDFNGKSREYKIVERYFAYEVEEYVKKYKEWNNSKYYSGFYEPWRVKLKQFFTDWSVQSSETFLEFKVPVWIFYFNRSQINGIINPRLKDYGFDRVKNSVTVFQDISMYLSNILVEQKEVIAVDDRLRVEKHGFDLKTSFRKAKNEKKS